MNAGTCLGCGGPLPASRSNQPRKWCSERCRKRQYCGKCVDCGAGLSWSDPPPKRCVPCRLRFDARNAWSQESIIRAIRSWVAEHGELPSAEDWNTPHGRPIPAVRTVQQKFGSWNAGIEAAGFEPTKRGHYLRAPRAGESLELCLELRRLYESGVSTSRLADDYACSLLSVRYRIRKAGGVIRPRG